jgi:BASS family bile acid:Na+ symporter
VEPLVLLLRVSVVIFMAGSLAAAGAAVLPRDAIMPLTQPRFLVRVLIASWVMPPIVAVGVLQAMPIDPGYAVGLWLLALAPCAPFAPAMARSTGGDAASMAAVMVLSAALTVVVMPFAVSRLGTGLTADPLAIAAPLVMFVLLPLAGGVAVRAIRPRLAEWLIGRLAIVTGISGGVALLLVAVLYGPGVVTAVGSHAIAAQLLFLAAITVAAHAIGAGLPAAQRSVLTIAVSTRNLGAALAPLVSPDSDPNAVVMVTIGAPATLVVSALATQWLRRRLPVGHAA